jgi:hypothetical protein
LSNPLQANLKTSWDGKKKLVIFELLTFRPFIGEIFLGKVQSISELGIKGRQAVEQITQGSRLSDKSPSIVTLGFFDDILIPPAQLPGYTF